MIFRILSFLFRIDNPFLHLRIYRGFAFHVFTCLTKINGSVILLSINSYEIGKSVMDIFDRSKKN